MLPGTALLAPVSSPVVLPPVRIGVSSEYSTFKRVIPRLFNSFRMTRHSGHTLVSKRSAIRNISGCSLFPVPILLMRGIPLFSARSARAIFALTVSMASMI